MLLLTWPPASKVNRRTVLTAAVSPTSPPQPVGDPELYLTICVIQQAINDLQHVDVDIRRSARQFLTTGLWGSLWGAWLTAHGLRRGQLESVLAHHVTHVDRRVNRTRRSHALSAAHRLQLAARLRALHPDRQALGRLGAQARWGKRS